MEVRMEGCLGMEMVTGTATPIPRAATKQVRRVAIAARRGLELVALGYDACGVAQVWIQPVRRK
jgi:hypothetical protein